VLNVCLHAPQVVPTIQTFIGLCAAPQKSGTPLNQKMALFVAAVLLALGSAGADTTLELTNDFIA
jgi:hypothetical protein